MPAYRCGHYRCSHLLTETDPDKVEAELMAHYEAKHPTDKDTGRKLKLVSE